MARGVRRRIVRVVVAVAVLVVGAVTTSAAAPAGQSGRSRPAATRSPVDQLPENHDYLVVRTGLATSARAGRAKIDIRVPKFTGVAYTLLFDLFPRLPNGYYQAPAGLLPRHPNPACRYTIDDLPALLVPVDVEQPDSKKSARYRSVGRLPDTPVSFLTFGSIPVTATLHLRLPIGRDSRVEPFIINGYGSGAAIFTDDPTGASGSCDRAWESVLSGGPPNYVGDNPTVVSGRIEVSVSDVRVDGHPVPVGSGCRTETPLSLNLIAQNQDHGGSGYDAQHGGVLRQQIDRRATPPSNPVAWYPDSTDLTIPAFTGCRGARGDDISRLITALASGPNNTLAVVQGDVSTTDPAQPSVCTTPDCFPAYAQPGVPAK